MCIRDRLDALYAELDGLGIATWTSPAGGYFVNLDVLDGTASPVSYTHLDVYKRQGHPRWETPADGTTKHDGCQPSDVPAYATARGPSNRSSLDERGPPAPSRVVARSRATCRTAVPGWGPHRRPPHPDDRMAPVTTRDHTALADRSPAELAAFLTDRQAAYTRLCGLGLTLDLTRGCLLYTSRCV